MKGRVIVFGLALLLIGLKPDSALAWGHTCSILQERAADRGYFQIDIKNWKQRVKLAYCDWLYR
jgi:hypothetical protein